MSGHQTFQAFRPRNQTEYILVDQLGNRFTNEKRIEHHIGVLAVNHYEGQSLSYPRIPCYAIYDEDGKESRSFAPSYSSGRLRHREEWSWSRSNGIVKKANTIEELAKLIKVPPQAMTETFRKRNDVMHLDSR